MSLSIDNITCSSFHFVGVFGSGMSALAQFLAWEKCRVSGSDRNAGDPATRHIEKRLLDCGIVLFPQDGSGIDSSVDAVVVSTAIEEKNPDLAAAHRANIPVIHRSILLAAIVSTRKTLAIAGTSGKSTVAALCFECLKKCGKEPSLITGANLVSLMREGLIGNASRGHSDILVIEADESDGSLVNYHPEISVFLNVSKDHKPAAETLRLFEMLASQSKMVIVNRDDPLCVSIPHAKSFGLASNADFHPDEITETSPRITFRKDALPVVLHQIGEHNLSNFLAAWCACAALGCGNDCCARAAGDYPGLERRFASMGTPRGIHVIDDYAHNPEKIRAALRAAQTLGPRVFAIFQPHGFGPARFMKTELADVFSQVLRPEDRLYMIPIYYAGGTAEKDISSSDIVALVRSSSPHIHTPASRGESIDQIVRESRPGDIILSMGARDPSLPGFAKEIVDSLGSA